MKPIILFIIVFAFFLGCSKSPNSLNSGNNNGGGGGLPSDTQPPTIPTNISGVATPNSILLSWSASTDNIGISGYKIFRNGNEIGTSGANTYFDIGLAANTSYSYRISAYDAAGNNSAQSAIFSIATTIQNADTASLISGRWGVIRDSVSNVGNFYFIQNGNTYVPTPGIYFGVPADYWDFKITGNLDVRENNNSYNNIPYQFLNNARLFINELSAAYNDAYILQLNTTYATLFWTNTSPNGGVYTRKLYLKK